MSVPLLSIAQMREWERAAWSAGKNQSEVIARVGERVAQHVLGITRAGDFVLILAGRGNNGADARAAGTWLSGRRVETLEITDPSAQQARLAEALAGKPALVIDGLFGIGLNRRLSQPWLQVIDTINQAGLDVLAVDVPSGLNADTGVPEGGAVKASITVTIGAPKAGMLAASAWDFVGRLVVVTDVGLGECPIRTETQWVLGADFLRFPSPRMVASHKGTYGHVGIMAGSGGYHGAATLAARGAQRAKPGLITLSTTEVAYPVVAPQLEAVMVRKWHSDAHLDRSLSAIVVGPGLAGEDVPAELSQVVRRLWRNSNHPVVVDASALAWLKAGVVSPGRLRVITPHPGEAARMLRTTVEAVQADRPKALRELSSRFGGAWVVLKGYQSLIGCEQGVLYVNSSGNPYLGQGGSGDLLAGFIGGLLAQRTLCSDPGKTLAYAAWEHGAAADRLQAIRRNWVVEDLAEELGNVA